MGRMPQCLSVPQGGLGIGSPTHWGGRGAHRCDLEDDKATFWFRDQFLICLCISVPQEALPCPGVGPLCVPSPSSLGKRLKRSSLLPAYGNPWEMLFLVPERNYTVLGRVHVLDNDLHLVHSIYRMKT